jgi:hypothetical protein
VRTSETPYFSGYPDKPWSLGCLDLPLVPFEPDWRFPPDEISEEQLFRSSRVVRHRPESMII